MANQQSLSSKMFIRSATTTRPEIQTLRAVAVLAVLAYHVFPDRIHGGFVGVDVFFAISGYLILGHLLRGLERQGTIRLADFWARRARRLLPASLLVLLVTGVTTVICVPQVLWRQWFEEIAASAGYVQNWLLASNAVDYLASDNAPSPAQHYWSLSVEEQLYLIWPVVFLLIVLLIRRIATPRTIRIVIGIILAAATLASFIYSVHEVAVNPAAAYFVTPTRAWEFGAGGLLAYFSSTPLNSLAHVRTAASWVGLLLIAFAILRFSATTPFPGAAALVPVIGTLFVIWGGLPDTPWSPRTVLSLRPIVGIGDISYSLYLWHWPLIVLLPFVLGQPLTTVTRLVLIVAAFVLAVLTKRFIEDPVRFSGLAVRPAWMSLTVCLSASLVILLGASTVYGVAQHSSDEAQATIEKAIHSSATCVGAAAIIASNHCARPFAVTQLTDTTFAQADIGKGVRVVDSCKQTLTGNRVITCAIGDTTNPDQTIALVGDSHMGQWIEALDAYGRTRHIEFITYIKTLCAGTGASGIASGPAAQASSITSCTTWGRRVLAAVRSNPKISVVIFTNYTEIYLGGSSTNDHRSLKSTDFVSAWIPLIEAGKSIVALRDTPNTDLVNAPQCIALHLKQYDPCTVSRDKSQLPDLRDPLLQAAKAVAGVRTIDPTDDFCGATTCHTVIGGLVVYFDDSHMTATFSRTLAPIIGQALARVIVAG